MPDILRAARPDPLLITHRLDGLEAMDEVACSTWPPALSAQPTATASDMPTGEHAALGT